MSDGQPLAQTLAARMQLGLLGTANTIAHSVRVGSGALLKQLKQGGLIRRRQPHAGKTGFVFPRFAVWASGPRRTVGSFISQ